MYWYLKVRNINFLNFVEFPNESHLFQTSAKKLIITNKYSQVMRILSLSLHSRIGQPSHSQKQQLMLAIQSM